MLPSLERLADTGNAPTPQNVSQETAAVPSAVSRPCERRKRRVYRTWSATTSVLLVVVTYTVVSLAVDLDEGTWINPLPFLLLALFPVCVPCDTVVETRCAPGAASSGGSNVDLWIVGCPCCDVDC